MAGVASGSDSDSDSEDDSESEEDSDSDDESEADSEDAEDDEDDEAEEASAGVASPAVAVLLTALAALTASSNTVFVPCTPSISLRNPFFLFRFAISLGTGSSCTFGTVLPSSASSGARGGIDAPTPTSAAASRAAAARRSRLLSGRWPGAGATPAASSLFASARALRAFFRRWLRSCVRPSPSPGGTGSRVGRGCGSASESESVSDDESEVESELESEDELDSDSEELSDANADRTLAVWSSFALLRALSVFGLGGRLLDPGLGLTLFVSYHNINATHTTTSFLSSTLEGESGSTSYPSTSRRRSPCTPAAWRWGKSDPTCAPSGRRSLLSPSSGATWTLTRMALLDRNGWPLKLLF